MSAGAAPNPSEMTVHLLWLNAGLSCDGDSVSLTAATLPSIEDTRRRDMATVTTTERKSASEPSRQIEMVWDPITRIVGSLGLYTRIDFEKREGAECFSTSSILPRLRYFHEGQGSARRALHHQSHLRDLR